MGARLIKDINSTVSSSPNELTSFNGLLFFSAELATKPSRSNNSNDSSLDTTDDTAIIEESPPNSSVGLIRSDGSEEGTTVLRSFNSVTNLVSTGDQLFFIAGVDNQYQLWASDGTARGTKQVKDLYPNADSNFPQDLFEVDGVLFYSAIDNSDDIQGGAEGGIGKYPYVNGYEVWRREGNGVGSRFFRNLIPDKVITDIEITENTADITTTIFENDSFPSNFIDINGNYFFTAQSSSFYSLETRTSDILIGGLELWFSDGTEAGTRPININQNTYTFYEPEDGEYSPVEQLAQPGFGFIEQSSSSFPRQLTPSHNKLFFVANDGITGFELWSITDQGTKPSLISDLNPGNTSSSPEELTVVGKNLYFSANEGNGRKLFYYNESLTKPKLVKNSGDNPESLTAVGKHLYYSAESELGRELWSVKKSKSIMVEDINPGSDSSFPSDMTMVTRIIKDKSKKRKSKYLYFTADDGSHGTEIMFVNLKTKKSKVRINADIIDGPSSSFPRELTNHNQQLYFTAKDSSKGRELWTVGPAIKGPSGESGASSSNIGVFENKTFVYQFKSDAESNKEINWTINGGDDAAFFQINSQNGRLAFKSKQNYINPKDHNADNIYEVFVRSTEHESGYKSDQLVNVSLSKKNTSNSKIDYISGEILYYTSDCGPITANGPLYPCNVSGSIPGGSDSDSSNFIASVPGNSELS